MKRTPALLLSVAVAGLSFDNSADAAGVSNKVIRKFKGVYEGRASGVLGLSTGGLLNLGPGNVRSTVQFTGKRVEKNDFYFGPGSSDRLPAGAGRQETDSVARSLPR